LIVRGTGGGGINGSREGTVGGDGKEREEDRRVLLLKQGEEKKGG